MEYNKFLEEYDQNKRFNEDILAFQDQERKFASTNSDLYKFSKEYFEQNEIKESSCERVNHPSHYTSGRVEVIDIIEDAIKDAPNTTVAGLQWQVLKYMLRLWLKDNPQEDAKKAQWYLNRLVDKM